VEDPDKWIRPAASFLTSPAVAEEIRGLLAVEAPDLVIVDAMFSVALLEAARFRAPSIVMVHTCVRRMLPQWRKMLETLANLRLEAGFGPIPAGLDEMWMSHDKLLVTTPKALDEGPDELAYPRRPRHVGPVLKASATRLASPCRGRRTTPLRSCSSASRPCPSRARRRSSRTRSTPSRGSTCMAS